MLHGGTHCHGIIPLKNFKVCLPYRMFQKAHGLVGGIAGGGVHVVYNISAEGIIKIHTIII